MMFLRRIWNMPFYKSELKNGVKLNLFGSLELEIIN